LRETFAAICLALLKDEVSLVRCAAMKQFVNVADLGIVNGGLRTTIAQLVKGRMKKIKNC
jgi:hypothetical protein